MAAHLGRHELACALLESAVARDPSQPRYRIDLIEAYRMEWRLDEALRTCEASLQTWPDNPAFICTRAGVLYDSGEVDQAIAQLRALVVQRPDYAGARWRLGQALLTRGDYRPGWAEYEWRFRMDGVPPILPPLTTPRWNGSNAVGGTLLVVCGEGFGDTIQLARYLPLAARRCRKLALGCSPEMQPLIAQFGGGADVFLDWAQMPAHAAHCVLTSMPFIFDTDISAPPGPVPYIRSDTERAGLWRNRLNAVVPAELFRVGLVWSGRPTNDRRRAIDIDHLNSLTAVPGIALLSLQKDMPAPVPPFRGPALFFDCAPQITDFIDTAAIMDNVDLVVSIDTAAAHLAGAMGRPVWTLLHYAADWRWLRGRDDTSWYPTMRLFRQSRPGDWPGVIATVARELHHAAAGRRPRS